MRSPDVSKAVNAVVLAFLFVVLAIGRAGGQEKPAAAGPTAADLSGAWSSTLAHDGEETPFALEHRRGRSASPARRRSAKDSSS